MLGVPGKNSTPRLRPLCPRRSRGRPSWSRAPVCRPNPSHHCDTTCMPPPHCPPVLVLSPRLQDSQRYFQRALALAKVKGAEVCVCGRRRTPRPAAPCWGPAAPAAVIGRLRTHAHTCSCPVQFLLRACGASGCSLCTAPTPQPASARPAATRTHTWLAVSSTRTTIIKPSPGGPPPHPLFRYGVGPLDRPGQRVSAGMGPAWPRCHGSVPLAPLPRPPCQGPLAKAPPLAMALGSGGFDRRQGVPGAAWLTDTGPPRFTYE